MKAPRWLFLIPATWALLPWLFWFAYQFHKPDHADVFWLAAIPFVYVSFIPMMLFGQGTQHPDWFPLDWVIGCSVFDLVVDALLFLIVWFILDTK